MCLFCFLGGILNSTLVEPRLLVVMWLAVSRCSAEGSNNLEGKRELVCEAQQRNPRICKSSQLIDKQFLSLTRIFEWEINCPTVIDGLAGTKCRG